MLSLGLPEPIPALTGQEAANTSWTSRKPLQDTYKNLTLTFTPMGLIGYNMQIFGLGGGNNRTWRKPTQTQENMLAPCRKVLEPTDGENLPQFGNMLLRSAV